ncbi:MAG: elongation factor Ts [bacterium]|nr:elongation factor Ts [Deltaproteobacteria bacterium]MCP4906713.1 elongation factor Ts [bacterium]
MAGISAGDVKALRDSTGAGMMDCKNALKEADGDVEKAMELLRSSGLAKAGKRAGRETSEGAVVFSLSGGDGALIELGCETDFVAKTPDFQGMAQGVADAAATAKAADVAAALAAPMAGGSVDDIVKAAVGKMGENIQLKRVASVSVSGVTGGYVHGGGKLGVLVALETAQSGDEVAAVARDVAMHVAAHDPTPIAVDRDDMPADVVEKERAFLTTQAKESGKPDNVIEKMVDGRINKFFAENCLLAQGFVKDSDKSVRDILGEAGQAAGGEIKVATFIRFKLGEAAE